MAEKSGVTVGYGYVQVLPSMKNFTKTVNNGLKETFSGKAGNMSGTKYTSGLMSAFSVFRTKIGKSLSADTTSNTRSVTEAFSSAGSKIKAAMQTPLGQMFTGIGKTALSTVGKIGTGFGALGSKIDTISGGAFSNFAAKGALAFLSVDSGARKMVSGIGSAINGIANSGFGKAASFGLKVGNQVGGMFVKGISTLKGGISSLGSKLGNFFGSKFGGSANSIFGKVFKIGLGAAAIAGLKSILSEGGKLQQSYLGGVETLYGKAAKSVRKYAREAAAAGISMNSYSEQAVSFGAALKKAYGGDVQKSAKAANVAILDMADNSAKMGTSMESIQMAYQGFAKQNYTMLDNLKLGYSGTKEEMQRLLADAEKLSGKKYDLSNLGDVYDAIHVIQKDLGLTGVAAKEAETTLSGSFNAMKAAAENFAGSLALGKNVKGSMKQLLTSANTFFFKNLIPMVGRAVKSLLEILPEMTSQVAGWIQEAVPKFVQNFSDSVQKNLPKLLTSIGNTIRSIGSMILTIIQNTPALIQAVLSAVQIVVNTILQEAPQIIAAIPQIIQKIGDAIITSSDMFLTAVKQIVGAISASLPGLVQQITAVLPGIINTIVSVIVANISAFIQCVVTVVSAIVKALPTIITALVNALPALITGIVDAIVELTPVLVQGLVAVVQAIVDALPQIIQGIVDALPQIVEALVNGIVELAPVLIQGAIVLVAAIVAAMPKIISALIKAIPEIIKAIVAGFSPLGGKLRTKFKAIWTRIKTDASGTWKAIGSAITGLAGKIKDKVTGKFEELKNKVKPIWDAIGKFMKDPIGTAKKGIETFIDGLKRSISSKFDAIKNLTANVWKKIREKISIDGVKEKIQGMIEKIKNLFPFNIGKALHIKLPHISIDGGKAPWGIGGKGRKPSFSISSWEAYANGGVLNRATIFGFNGNNPMVGGEQGPEAVAPISTLQSYITDAVKGAGTTIVVNLSVNANADNVDEYASELARALKRELRMVG